MKLADSVTALSGVGGTISQKLAQLDIFTVQDLLYSFPRKYLDYRNVVKLTALRPDVKQSTILQVKSFTSRRIFRGRIKSIQKAVLADETGEIPATWFNMPYLENSLTPGRQILVNAQLKPDKRSGEPVLIAPEFEAHSEEYLHGGRIVPVYHLTAGLSPKIYRRLLKRLIDRIAEIDDLDSLDKIDRVRGELDELPLISLPLALTQIHFPTDYQQLKEAQYYLGILELLPIQLKLIAQEQARRSVPSAMIIENKLKDKDLLSDYWNKYDFKSTSGQLSATKNIAKAMRQPHATYRLIQGDVGSGKTAVAGFAVYISQLMQKDAVILVPTTVLAEQHFALFVKLFGETAVELVTKDTKIGLEKGKAGKLPGAGISKSIKSPRAKIYIGTQALLNRYYNLKLDLGVLIVDEEHRFGVKQRDFIQKLTTANQKLMPHYLSLTATPIPRSLAIGLFGNVDLDIIKSRPKQQLPKITYLVPQQKRAGSLDWVLQQINLGNQVYWLCPLIEKEENLSGEYALISADEKATVVKKYKELSEHFSPAIKLGMLHGKMKNEDKRAVLQDFKSGKFQILVCTTVIEVGIDIPQANVMVIEDGEQFGLAQLHQLRGRVGRGAGQGYCLVFYTGNAPASRLRKFATELDGLKLAEFDLSSRGPGEVYGYLQSGVPQLQVADLRNRSQVEISRKLAEKLSDETQN